MVRHLLYGLFLLNWSKQGCTVKYFSYINCKSHKVMVMTGTIFKRSNCISPLSSTLLTINAWSRINQTNWEINIKIQYLKKKTWMKKVIRTSVKKNNKAYHKIYGNSTTCKPANKLWHGLKHTWWLYVKHIVSTNVNVIWVYLANAGHQHTTKMSQNVPFYENIFKTSKFTSQSCLHRAWWRISYCLSTLSLTFTLHHGSLCIRYDNQSAVIWITVQNGKHYKYIVEKWVIVEPQ